MMRTIAALFLAFGSMVVPLHGVTGGVVQRPEVKRLAPEQGVPLHLTYCMTQTADGFLWFGTMYGLYRYDGYEYRSYRYDPDDRFSLSDDDVTVLFEDRSGFLWVGTYSGGVNRLDRSTGRFERIFGESRSGIRTPHTIWAITQDHEGVVWFGTEEAGLIGLKENGEAVQFLNAESDPASLRSDRVPQLAVDRSGRVWVVNSPGMLYSIGPGDPTPVRRTVGAGLGPEEILSVAADTIGRIWVGTASTGIVALDCETGDIVSRLPLVRDSKRSGVRVPRTAVLNVSPAGEVIAGTGAGVFFLGSEPGGAILVEQSNEDPGSLYNHQIVSLLSDQSGMVWVSCYQGGVVKIIRSPSPFAHYRPEPLAAAGTDRNLIRGISRLEGNRFVAVTRDAMFEIEPGTNRLIRRRLPAPIDGKLFLTAVLRDSNGMVWLGSRQGLYLLTGDLALSRVFRGETASPNNISSGVVNTIAEGTDATSIRFRIDERGSVLLTVFDILGREVATLVDDLLDAGSYSVLFRPGQGGSSGVYFYRLQTGGTTMTRRMLLLK